MKEASDRTANLFRALGIGKGDPVMLILKRRYEFWFCLLALHKLGAVAIPATHQLTPKDLVYRNNAADVKMIVATADPLVLEHVDACQGQSPSLKLKVAVGGPRAGWIDFDRVFTQTGADFARPSGADAPGNRDISLLYFTSGTTGYPKMVRHNFTYPLGHILTAGYWQNVQDNGLHFTVSDTGWAKSVWGKIYGQWLAGSAVFVYDYDKFVPQDLLKVIVEHGVTTFCAPPDDLPLPDQGGPRPLRPVQAEIRGDRRRAPEPGGLQPVPAPHRAQGARRLRPDRVHGGDRHLSLDGTPARLHGPALAGLRSRSGR